MHSFPELIERCTAFTLRALHDAEAESIERLQTSATSSHVKELQMAQLQRVVSAVGMISIFDALLQDQLGGPNGFKAADLILKSYGAEALREKFEIFRQAINVLKHGKGESYESLLQKASLPFRMMKPDERMFDEGDVSEVQTLIKVDDEFLIACADTIREVSRAIHNVGPNFSPK